MDCVFGYLNYKLFFQDRNSHNNLNFKIFLTRLKKEQFREVLLVDWLLILVAQRVVNAVGPIQCERVEKLVQFVLDVIVLWKKLVEKTFSHNFNFKLSYRWFSVLHQLIKVLLLQVLYHLLLFLFVDLILFCLIIGRC